MIIFLRRALLFVLLAAGELKNKVFMECSRTSLLVLFPFSSDEALQAASPSPAAPIPVTRYCSHAGISNRFPLGARAGDAGGWWGGRSQPPPLLPELFQCGAR